MVSRRFPYSSVYSCHLFLISSASVKSLSLLSFIVPILTWNVPFLSPIFLKRFLIFPILLFSSISLHWSLKKASYLSLLFSGTLHPVGPIFPFLPCFLLPLFPQLCVQPPQMTSLPSWNFGGKRSFWSPPLIQCYKSPSIVLQALSLPDLIPFIYPSPLLYNHKGFDLRHIWMV